MADKFDSNTPGLSSPATSQFAIAPSDSADLAQTTRALYVGTGGDIAVILKDDIDPVVLKNVPDGAILPVRAVRVRATGTTADDIVGWY